jgi:hypothetical protein
MKEQPPNKDKLLDKLPFSKLKIKRAVNTGKEWKQKEEVENVQTPNRD